MWQYNINQTTGVLTPMTQPSAPSGSGTTAITLDPSGKFAYATNRDANTVSMFIVNPTTGALSPNTTATIPAGQLPFRALFDPSGKFLYVVNEESATSVYTLNNDGTLKPAGTTGSQSVAMAIAAVK